ncbi:MAG: cation diffusion facilitator family transporter [Solirubrobacteraceae bacterium]
MAGAHEHHGHGHGDGHDHHGVSPDADRRWLAIALGVIAAFMALEVVGGVLASSLALLSDAGHMLTDAAALAVALWAAALAARPAAGRFTFGFGRAEVLSAQANGATLLVLAGIIAVEAVRRLGSPPDVDGAFVLVVGLVGAAANVGAAAALARAKRQSLNIAGARAHVLTDLYASLAAAAAGLVILLTGFDRADAIASLLVAGLMLRSGWALLSASGRVLLEAAPEGLDPDAVGRALAAAPGVLEVHDLHVWEVTTGFPALAAHVLVRPGDDCHATRRRLQAMVDERFGLRHVTLQVDHGPADEQLLAIESRPGAGDRRP